MTRFHVVHFLEEDSLAVVPEHWECSGYTRWPPVTSSTKINKYVYAGVAPKETWSKLKTRIIYSSDSYEKARRKMRKAEETSDLASESDRFVESVGFTDHIEELEESPSLLPRITPGETSVNSCIPESSRCQAEGVSYETFKNFQREVFKSLEEIQAAVDRNTHLLMKLQSKSNLTEVPQLCSLPANHPEELVDFEKLLDEKDNFHQYVEYFSNIGGTNVRDCTRRILQKIVSNSLSTLYNWKGTGGVKLSFESLTNIVMLILLSVRRSKEFEKATDFEILGAIKKWLMHAKDRDGGRMKRI